ncbi:tetratricopeptide repeat protein, partial [bacterium]|nr:tetratricopeptide repeat protein [bacterium]
FDWKNEFTLWQSAVAARPENPKGYINLGNAYFDRDDIDTALKHWRKALSMQQDLPQVWVNMGNAIKRQGDFAEAETCYRKALDILPEYGLAHFNLALLLEKQGKSDPALKHMLIAAEYMYGKRNENRRKGLAHYHCARMLAARQEMAKALPHLVRAERLAPRFAPLYLLKGTLADNPQDARQAFKMAIRLDPTHGEAYFNLGVLEWRLGNTSLANQLWEKAVKFNPSIQEMVENIKKTTNS